MNAKDKNSATETPLKTPPKKKARMITPSKGNNTGSGTGTRSVYVHVATPYPSKYVKNLHCSKGVHLQPVTSLCSPAANFAAGPSAPTSL
ncbi:hypothetical protein PVAP13_8NG211902 [Panicum virgatum]|uniref:Uncharacterized protein n=1 Tax=Panicum virgatum TaxID=38727 RepID=A0A8T0P404_PANVG|nr:hypothetical protein PVAP13_8NG211902 [Panicum virgatum]